MVKLIDIATKFDNFIISNRLCLILIALDISLTYLFCKNNFCLKTMFLNLER